MTGKRKRGEGLRYSGKKLRFDSPKAREKNLKTLCLSAGNPNSGGVLEFELTLHDNEWARFVPAPFSVQYTGKYKNKNYSSTDTAKDSLAGTEYPNVQAGILKPGVFFPPEQGVGALFSKVEVFVDGHLIGAETDMSGHNRVYQLLNRVYSGRRQRGRLGQETLLKNGAERSFRSATQTDADPVKVHPNYLTLARRTDHNTFSGKCPLNDNFTLDGNFGVSPPFNEALHTLSSDSRCNSNNYFPPHTNVVVRLHPAQPRYSMMDWTKVEKEEILSSDPLTAAKVDSSLAITIESITMKYELVNYSAEVTKSLLEKPLNFPFNNVFIDKIALEKGHQQTVVSSRVPRGARIAFLATMKEHHLWYNETTKKNTANFMQFPTTLHKIGVHLAGHGPLVADTGLTELGGQRANGSSSVNNYFAQLKELGITDLKFEDMFPKDFETKVPLLQSLFLDLRPYTLEEGGKLNITLDFDSTLSPDGTKIIVCYVMEKILHRSRDKKWTVSR